MIVVALPRTTAHSFEPTYCSHTPSESGLGRRHEKNDNADRNDQKKTTHQFNWEITTFAIDWCCITGWEIFVEKDTTTRIRTERGSNWTQTNEDVKRVDNEFITFFVGWYTKPGPYLRGWQWTVGYAAIVVVLPQFGSRALVVGHCCRLERHNNED